MPVDTRSKSPVLLPLWCVEPKVLITSAVREVKASRSPGMVQSCIWMSRSCFGISSTGKFVTCRLVLGFDIVTPEWVGDIARSLLVVSATINIWGGAQIIQGFATLKNIVNLQFASEVRLDISKSVLSKSRLHSYMPSWKKFGGQKCVLSLRVKRFWSLEIIAARVIPKRKIEEKVRSFALREDEVIQKATNCQQGEAKRGYGGFVTVVISIIIIVLLLVLFEE